MSSAAFENLRDHQGQADMDGVMVTVSRQAVEEVLDEYRELERQLAELQAEVEIYRDQEANSRGYNDWEELQQALQGEECDHNWVCGDNVAVSNAEVCTKCKQIRTAPTAKEFGGSDLEALLNQKEGD